MPKKVAFVVSFDVAREDSTREILEDATNALGEHFRDHPNLILWAGTDGSAVAVLNTIGID